MGSHTAFFYGTLMAPQVLHRVIYGSPNPSDPTTKILASQLRIRPAVLHGYQRHKVRFADYPAIRPKNDSTTVRGTLVEGLTDGDIWRLDIFEGSEYTRRKVMVKVLSSKDGEGEGMGDVAQKEDDNVEGEEIEAETYVWIAGESQLEMKEWDFSEFVRDKMSRWVGSEGADMDEGFQDVDDAVASLPDPTGGRGVKRS